MSHYSRELHSMLRKTMMRAYRIHAHSKLGTLGGRLDLICLDVLQQLAEQPMTLKDLGKESELGRVDLQKYVTYLIKAGYIQKQVHQDDRRSIWLSLTELGKHQLEGAVSQLASPLDFALADLTINEERAVLKYLSRLHQGLKQLEDAFERPIK